LKEGDAMKHSKVAGCLILGLVFGMPQMGEGADEMSPQPPLGDTIERVEKKSSPETLPLYKPPKGSVPGGRLKGGSRGRSGELPVVQVLAPNHVGLTRHKQPILYWYISGLTSYPVEFTLVDSRTIAPILETRLKAPAEAGVQHIRLRDFGITLEPGVPYRWFVTLVIDPGAPSRDIVAGAIIERMDYVESLIINAAGEEDPLRLAAAGLWYDAIRKLSESIEAAPNDPFFRMQRAALLSQVGLPEIAESDLKRNTKG
jgi:uncharacterized protein DUF928